MPSAAAPPDPEDPFPEPPSKEDVQELEQNVLVCCKEDTWESKEVFEAQALFEWRMAYALEHPGLKWSRRVVARELGEVRGDMWSRRLVARELGEVKGCSREVALVVNAALSSCTPLCESPPFKHSPL